MFPKIGTVIETTGTDRLLIATLGIHRQRHNEIARQREGKRCERGGTWLHMNGAGGEVAAAKLLGHYPNTFSLHPEFEDGFVPGTFIPYDVKHTEYDNGKLLIGIKEKGKPYLHGLYMLFTGDVFHELTFRGCLPAEEIIRHEMAKNPKTSWSYTARQDELWELDRAVKFYEGVFSEKHPGVYATSDGFDGSTPREPILSVGVPADAGRLPGDGPEGRPAEVAVAGPALRDG